MNGVRAETEGILPETAVQRAAAGDGNAWEELARAYYPSVYKYVLASESRGGNEQDAWDITQSTFLRASAALPTYQGAGSFKAWLFVIAKRTASDFYRQRGTAPAESEAEQPSEKTPAVEVGTPLDALLNCEADHQVRMALAQLSSDHREVLACRVFNELSVRETASVMGRSEAAVKMLQLRAMAALAKSLEGRNAPYLGGR